jgi:tRNA threonylcarbamoyladenosine biosynthesis protein TsaE
MSILERLRQGVSTGSAEETRALAAELAAALPTDTTLALHGDLGVGKTTFVQGLARGFGITAPVTSPTYTIYNLLRSEGRKNEETTLLVHLDAYRIDSPAQIEALLLDDFLTSPYCLAVEWPEKVADWLPPDAWHLDLGITNGERHTIRLRAKLGPTP